MTSRILKKIIYILICTIIFSAQVLANEKQQSIDKIISEANHGDRVSQYILSICYREGRLVPKNDYEAHKWLEKSARSGFPPAQLALSSAYFEGKHIPKDYQKSFEFAQKAANSGHRFAQCFLGYLYYQGFGTRQDFQKAFKWTKLSSDRGETLAHFQLAIMYENGKGIPKNKTIAKELYGKSCDQGYQNGCNKFRELNELGY